MQAVNNNKTLALALLACLVVVGSCPRVCMSSSFVATYLGEGVHEIRPTGMDGARFGNVAVSVVVEASDSCEACAIEFSARSAGENAEFATTSLAVVAAGTRTYYLDLSPELHGTPASIVRVKLESQNAVDAQILHSSFMAYGSSIPDSPPVSLARRQSIMSERAGSHGEGQPSADPAEVRGMVVHPNPFNPRTTIRFDGPSPGRYQVQVFSIDGRLVWSDSLFTASGTGIVVWHGLEANGVPVATGVYLAIVRGRSWSAKRKLVLLR